MSNKQNDTFFESKKEAEDEKVGMKEPKSTEKNKKNLYCLTCKEYPDKIIERYLDPIEETREWNADTGGYGLIDGNFSSTEYEQLCAKCRSKLIFKE